MKNNLNDKPNQIKNESNTTKKIPSKKKIINFCTSNKNKYEELVHLFKNELPEIEIKQTPIDLPELQGDPEQIVKSKLQYALNTKAKGNPILVEDTSLCFNAYGGLPGPYIKHFEQQIKPEGLFKMVCVFDDHSAYAQSIFGIQKNKRDGPHLFIGKTEGEIVYPRGPRVFGWAPNFQPNGYNKTYAEMEKDEKNQVSQRGKAMKQLIQWLKDNPNFW